MADCRKIGFNGKNGEAVKRGVSLAMPIVVGYLPIGFAFGVLAAAAGLSVSAAAAMSIFVYAGSAQLIAVGIIESGAGPQVLAVTVFLVNLRHLLMSSYLAPYLGVLRRWQQAIFCFQLTDESFAVHSTVFRENGTAGPPASLFALNGAAHLSWITGSLAGAWAGSRLLVDTRLFGLDYALPAMFIALLVMQADNRRRIMIALLAAGLSITLYLSGAIWWHIIIATVVAAAVGALTENEEETEGADKL